jgi:hypothetical protein
MVSTYIQYNNIYTYNNNTITQCPCFCVPYLVGTEPIVPKPQAKIWELKVLVNTYSPSRSGKIPNEMVK